MTASTRVTHGSFERIYDPSVGEAEAWYINDHTFVRDHDATWHMFGITHAEPMNPHDEKHLAHATAPALGGPWTKQPFALSADAAWGETQLWAPHVIEHEGLFYMFVCGGGAKPQEYRIQLATSPDCWSWTRHADNPIVVDGYEARDPMVTRIDGRWVMYYTATSEPGGGHHVVVATESDDLLHWRGRRVVYEDEYTGDMGGPTESPFVFEREGKYYLLIGPDWDRLMKRRAETGRYSWAGYRGTRVLESDDPLHFEVGSLAGFLDSHASEVVLDAAGEWWVSHCGWNQGGLYLARMLWE